VSGRGIDLRPVVLEGRGVRLEPLTLDHHAALCEVGLDPALWRWTLNLVRTAEEMQAYIEGALAAQAEGTALPFAIRDRASDRLIGSTRFGNMSRADRRVEIGWTWIARPWQRTAANTETKYLMLTHAFDRWGCTRVEFKTDAHNAPSRRALLRIGAVEEGVLRHHMVTATGRIRDTVYYSILDTEWPRVKAALEEKLRGPRPQAPGPAMR